MRKMNNMTGQQKLHATMDNYRVMIALVCEKKQAEIKAEQVYDKAFNRAIRGEAKEERTKELREAAADVEAWKEKVAYDIARGERVSAEYSLKICKSRIDELKMVRDMLCNDLDADMLFDGWSDAE